MARRPDRSRPRRPNATGRTDKSARFTMLPHRVLESAAYASLDLVERALLVEVLMIFNGDNNGSLYLSVRDAAHRLGRSDFKPIVRAFERLRDRRLIDLAKDAHFAVKAADSSRARCWRIAWHPWPECPVKARRGPCWDFEQYSPPAGAGSKRADMRLRALAKHRKDAAAGRLPVVETTTTEVILPKNEGRSVEENTTGAPRSDAKPPFVVVGESTTHIDITMGRACLAWWQCQLEGQIRGQILALYWLTQNRPNFAKAA